MVLWAIVCCGHTAGCRVERKDKRAPGADDAPVAVARLLGRRVDEGGSGGQRAEPTDGANASTTEGGYFAGTDDPTEGASDSVDEQWSNASSIRRDRREKSDDPTELPHAELVRVRRSNIPTAGRGLFAKADIPANTYLGDYMGQYLTEEEVEVLPEFESAYLFEIPRCAGIPYDSIAGDPRHYVSKANFAPSELNGEDTNLQNVEWETFCEEPYVRLYSTREIAAGEELYVDYGPGYGYEFMEDPQVQEFFMTLVGISSEDGFVFEYSGRS